jgi:hypothetical protein
LLDAAQLLGGCRGLRHFAILEAFDRAPQVSYCDRRLVPAEVGGGEAVSGSCEFVDVLMGLR